MGEGEPRAGPDLSVRNPALGVGPPAGDPAPGGPALPAPPRTGLAGRAAAWAARRPDTACLLAGLGLVLAGTAYPEASAPGLLLVIASPALRWWGKARGARRALREARRGQRRGR